MLKELSGLRESSYPEVVLPAPKSVIRDEINSELEKNPAQDYLLNLEATLNLFTEKASTTRLTAVLITTPFLISLLFTILIVIQGASWLWLLIPIPFVICAAIALEMRMYIGRKNFGAILLEELLKFIAFGLTILIFYRLVLYSAFYGLYASTIENFSIVGILSAFAALVAGGYFTRAANRLYYFLFVSGEKKKLN